VSSWLPPRQHRTARGEQPAADAAARGRGVRRSVASFAGAFFALHPANVEAVAWISQLKSVLALFFSLIALLRFRERPCASALIFGLGLLSKASAAFALPMLGALCWAWRGRGEVDKAHARGLMLWCLALLLFIPLQLATFTSVGGDYTEPYADVITMLRTMAAIGARYIALAFSGVGTSFFHEIEPVSSFADPWWIAALFMVPVSRGASCRACVRAARKLPGGSRRQRASRRSPRSSPASSPWRIAISISSSPG
jgi:hypothetical protein